MSQPGRRPREHRPSGRDPTRPLDALRGSHPRLLCPAVEDEAIRDLSRGSWQDADRRISRPPSFVSKPCCSAMRSAIWVARPGARPISRWLAAVVCATPAQHLVFQAYVRAVHEHTTRLQRLVQELAGTGHILASAPGGRGPCGPAWRAVHRGCDPRGRARRPARASRTPGN